MLVFLFVLATVNNSYGQFTIDHNHTDINELTESDINLAKSYLHIVYGHTSHGSQVTDGMTGLVTFANNGGKGLSLPTDIFAWNNGGTNGALDLHDYGMGGDVGYYPAWYNNTVNYLESPDNSDVNVVMWSWCGQVDDKYASDTLYSEYLAPMTLLEETYPQVIFIYMTGHVDHWDDANNKAANQVIRDYCRDNDKVLYDFADIESWNPDGTFFEYPNDNCDYYAGPDGPLIGNWAVAWRAGHTEGVDWYDCNAAHSDALNANQKAYAAWHLFSMLSKMIAPCGDISNDNDVDLEDLILALQITTGREITPNIYADCNGDKKIGIAEALEILAGIN